MSKAPVATTTKKPVQKFKVGFIETSIWANDNGYYSVVLSRTYKDGDEYRNTDSLSHGDIANAILVLEKAEAWLSSR